MPTEKAGRIRHYFRRSEAGNQRVGSVKERREEWLARLLIESFSNLMILIGRGCFLYPLLCRSGSPSMSHMRPYWVACAVSATMS